MMFDASDTSAEVAKSRSVARDGPKRRSVLYHVAGVEYARPAYLFRAVKPTTYGGGTSGTYGRAVANW